MSAKLPEKFAAWRSRRVSLPKTESQGDNRPGLRHESERLRPVAGGRCGSPVLDRERRGFPMKKLQIVGTGCPKCKKPTENTEAATRILDGRLGLCNKEKTHEQ